MTGRRAMTRAGRPVAILVALATLAGACSSSPAQPPTANPTGSAVTPASASHAIPNGAVAGVDDATWQLVDRLTADTYTADTTDAMRTGLAAAGIAVVPDNSTDPGSPAPEVALTGPRSPFELLDFQAHALAVGAWGGAGWTGAELDTVVPLPEGTTGEAPASVLLAGYVATANTPGGALSRALVRGQDLLHPATVRFPAAVLVLFVSDLATDGGRLAAPNASPTAAAGLNGLLAQAPMAVTRGPVEAPPAKLALAVDTVCSDTSNWMQGMLNDLFEALKVATPDNVPGAIVASIWNWIVDVVHTLVNNLIASVTDAVMGTIRSIGATIAAVAEQVATILPYVVKVKGAGADGSQTINLGTDPVRGAFTAVVTAGDLPSLPAVLTDCAKALDVALPDFHAGGAPVTWGPIAGHMDPLLAPVDSAATNTVTDDAGTSTWGFLTSRDPGDPNGEPTGQLDTMPVTIHRPEIAEARDKLGKALLGFIPAQVWPFVLGLFKPYLDGLQGRLNDLLDARGTGTVALTYHEKATPTPVPSLSPLPSGSGAPACAATLPAGTYQGTFQTDSTTIVPPGEIDLGESGVTNVHGTGPLTVTVASDGTLSGTFSLTSLEHAEYHGLAEGTQETTIEEQGAGVSGTLCSLVLTYASETITACSQTGKAPAGACDAVGTTTSLAGLVPPLPMGAPTSVVGKTLTWSLSSESGFDAGFGGLTSEVQGTVTATLHG
jgi:hypothetical protein